MSPTHHQIDRDVIDAAMVRARRERSLAFWAILGALHRRAASAFHPTVPQVA